MSTKYKFRDQSKLYFVTFATVYWIDVFTRNEYKDTFLDCVRYCQSQKGLEIYSWVIMSNHVHLIIGTTGMKMEDILRDLKRVSSKRILRSIENNVEESRKEWMLWLMSRAGKKNSNNSKFQFWNQHNHPIELADNRMMQQKLDYIHNNPVKAGWVDFAKSYIYSSARDYEGEKGLLDLKFIELIEVIGVAQVTLR